MQIKDIIKENINVINTILVEGDLLLKTQIIIDKFVETFETGNAVYFCGNGGSMADASHIAAELSGRFYLNRKPLKALALANNPAFCTAVANDFSYDDIFSRELEALGVQNDVLVAISTSGSSPNIIKALKIAKEKGIYSIGFTGENPSTMDHHCDVVIKIPSSNTPRIQEAYKLLLHIICEKVESELFSNDA
jgi:D-sedoheptulose 7-phosphate isomerase